LSLRQFFATGSLRGETNMRRRAFLASVGGLVATGGCLSRRGGGGDATPETAPPDERGATTSTTDSRSTYTDPVLVETSFEANDACSDAGTASVTAGERTVTVRGCLRAENGCSVATLGAVLVDTASRALTVIVETDSRSDGEGVCTEAIVPRGYEASITFDRGRPRTVTVVHDDVRGRHDVAEQSIE
jgi:hypothetical protein